MLKLTPLKQPVFATVNIPGSKSITNRALIMAALTPQPVTIVQPLESDDTAAMIGCLERLGIAVGKKGTDFVVTGNYQDVQNRRYDLNAYLSGTTIRFMLALSCIVPGTKYIHGVGRLNERPIGDLVTGLRQLGADITYSEKEGYPPLIVRSSTVPSQGTVRINGNVSSQYITALMMIAPVIGGLTLDVRGSQVSRSYIDMTIRMMKEWGIAVHNQEYHRYIIPAGRYEQKRYIIEGDYSAAGYFGAIAALTGSTITLNNLESDSVQGDKQFFNILESMGNRITGGEHQVIVHGHGVIPVTVSMEQCPDQAQTLAVLAAFARGKTVMTGVRSLRVKETERVHAIAQELGTMGIRTEAPGDDTLIVYGGEPHAAIIVTYGDHRMAMSFAVAGAKIPGMQIKNPDVVKKTFPGFWDEMKNIGISI